MSPTAAPAAFVPPPAPESSIPAAFGPVGRVVRGDGWVFIPASPFCSVPTGWFGGEITRSAACALARAVVGFGHQAWSGRGPSGAWGVFVAAP